jgi:PAS domain S-box-containing protein
MTEHKETIKPKILIVEDEAIIAIDLKSCLEQLGYTVLAHVDSAEKALKLAEQDPPDLVLMDIVLKGRMDGIEAGDIIRSRWGIPVVFCTAYADQERLERAKLVRPFGYILKPFQDNDVKVTVEMALYVSKVDRERRKAEEALKESEGKYRLIAENMADIIAVLDMNLRFTYISPSIRRIRGLTVEEAVEQTLDQALTPESRKIVLAAFEEEMNLEAGGTADPDRIRTLEVEEYRKDGSTIWMEVGFSFLRDENQIAFGILSVSRDISERKRIEKALHQSEDQYRDLVEFSRDLMCIHDLTGKILWVSEEPIRILGYEKDVILRMNIRDFLPSDRKDEFDEYLATIRSQGVASGLLKTYTAKGEKRIWEYYNTLRTEGVAEPVVRGMARDITERKLAEEALQKSEAQLRAILDATPFPIALVDVQDNNIDFWSRSALTLFGHTAATAPEWYQIAYPDPDYQREVIDRWKSFLEIARESRQTINTGEYRVTCSDGSVRICELYATFLAERLIVTFNDITERKRTEEAVQESEKRYRELYDFLPIPVYEMDFEGNITSVNRAVYETFKGTEEDLKKGFKAWQLLSPEETERSIRNIQRMLKGEQLAGAEYTLKRLDGSVFPALIISSVIYRDGKPVGLRGAIVDITEHKRAKKALNESENKYRLLADNVNDVIFVLDMNLNYTYVSPSVKILRGYEPEEVLKLPSIETLTPSSWDLAMRTLSEIMALEKSGSREIPLSRTLQLEMRRKDGSTVWTEVKFSFIRDENQRPLGILGVTRDITLRNQVEKTLQETIERLRKAVNTTIQVMVSSVETRDPYTAGHQTRSADLARAIAAEMGLSQDKIEGLRIAGSIHDIGKLSIPAEILSKPTKLSELEFSLIKEHAHNGYEILKNVESPWPLAEMVYQHHERMDGSGYPRGLKGVDILLGARILAVADVVEAMASHRPYRPALGIEAALGEIEKNKGILYDPEVVDVCLRLFKDRAYKFG